MGVIDPVLEAAEIVARPRVGGIGDDPLLLQLWIPAELRRLTLSEIGEDQAEILADRVAPDLDPIAEGLRLGRLFRALPASIVLPAMVEAPKLVALDPSRAEL